MEVQGEFINTETGNINQLDTVRALHQTVVSLRAALEASKTELNDLRHKYEAHLDTSLYCGTVEKLTLENHSLQRKLVNEPDGEKSNSAIACEESPKKVTFQLTDSSLDESDNFVLKGEILNNAICENNVRQDQKINLKKEDLAVDNVTVNDLDKFIEEKVGRFKDTSPEHLKITSLEAEKIEAESNNQSETSNEESIDSLNVVIIGENNCTDRVTCNIVDEYDTKIELESKFDFTIKVSTSKGGILQPLEIETVECSDFSLKNIHDRKQSQSTDQKVNDPHRIYQTNLNRSKDVDASDKSSLKSRILTADTLDMAGSREGDNAVNRINDKFNVQVKITSEENLIIDPSFERESNSDNLNVEADEASVRSISEGDNSVFSETLGAGTGPGGGNKRLCEQDSISGNDSEEVDDIELIFTTDDTKELTGFQEDLVSITEGDNWTDNQSDASTPILLKFNLLDPEVQSQRNQNTETDNFENENQENTNLQEVFADASISNRKSDSFKGDRFTDKDSSELQDEISNNLSHVRRRYLRSSSSKNYLDASENKQLNRKSFESNESVSFDNHKSYSFDNTKSSSFDRGSSVDVGTRDLSFDQREESLDQFDVLRTTMRTQYSVCVETDISKCGVMEDDGFQGNLNMRRNTCPNPFQYRPLSHREAVRGSAARPMLAPPIARGPRRSSAAQTDISALPNHWRSDTHLARKVLPLALTTLPSKVCGFGGGGISRLAPPASLRPARRSEETRRVLLSDIGFTSMVPELSRSAEPVWGPLGAASVNNNSALLTHTSSNNPPPLPLCCAMHAMPSFGSVPSSPTRQLASNTDSRYWSRGSMQRSVSGKMGDSTHSGSQRVTFVDETPRGGWRGSMPELGVGWNCCGRMGGHTSQKSVFGKGVGAGDSGDSTEELLDEAERFIRTSIDCLTVTSIAQDDFIPSRSSRPYLPSGPRQLRLGHLVKVIAPHGRVAVGKVRYVGIAGGPSVDGASATTFIGIQVGVSLSSCGGGDGSFRGRRYFHCQSGRSIFVPFSKVIMAWADC